MVIFEVSGSIVVYGIVLLNHAVKGLQNVSQKALNALIWSKIYQLARHSSTLKRSATCLHLYIYLSVPNHCCLVLLCAQCQGDAHQTLKTSTATSSLMVKQYEQRMSEWSYKHNPASCVEFQRNGCGKSMCVCLACFPGQCHRESESSLKYAFPHPTESSVFLPITSTSLLPHQPCIIHPQSIHPPLGPMLAEKRFSLFYYLKSVLRSLSILLSLFLAFSVFLYLSDSAKNHITTVSFSVQNRKDKKPVE